MLLLKGRFVNELVLERLVVATSCVVFYLLTVDVALPRNAMLAVLSLLACAEKICSIMNMVAVEKDWVSFIGASQRIATDSLGYCHCERR